MATFNSYVAPYRGGGGQLPEGYMAAATAPGRYLAAGISKLGDGLGQAIANYRQERSEQVKAKALAEASIADLGMYVGGKIGSVDEEIQRNGVQNITPEQIDFYNQHSGKGDQAFAGVIGEKLAKKFGAGKTSKEEDLVIALKVAEYKNRLQQEEDAAPQKALQLAQAAALRSAEERERKNQAGLAAALGDISAYEAPTVSREVTETIPTEGPPMINTTEAFDTGGYADAMTNWSKSRMSPDQEKALVEQIKQYGAQSKSPLPQAIPTYAGGLLAPSMTQANTWTDKGTAEAVGARAAKTEEELINKWYEANSTQQPNREQFVKRSQTVTGPAPVEVKRTVQDKQQIRYSDLVNTGVTALAKAGATADKNTLEAIQAAAAARTEDGTPSDMTVTEQLKIRAMQIHPNTGYTGMAPSESQAEKFNDAAASVASAMPSLNRLLEMVDIPGKSLRIDLRKEANALRQILIGNTRLDFLGPGVITNDERKIIEGIIAIPTEVFSLDAGTRASLEAVKNKLVNGLAAKAHVLGLTPVNGASTAAPDGVTQVRVYKQGDLAK